MPAVFQIDVIVISDAINAVNGETLIKQEFGQVIADKASRSGDENAFHALQMPLIFVPTA